ARPEAGSFPVRSRRARLRLRVRVEDHLLQVVGNLRPHDGVDVELVAVRRRELVDAADVLDGDAVTQKNQSAARVRRLLGRRRSQFRRDRRRNYHQSTASSISSPAQNGAERYFQPPSARSVTTTAPSGSSSAMRLATCTAAPAETPAKSPSRSSR